MKNVGCNTKIDITRSILTELLSKEINGACVTSVINILEEEVTIDNLKLNWK
jgi:hypothetical protein